VDGLVEGAVVALFDALLVEAVAAAGDLAGGGADRLGGVSLAEVAGLAGLEEGVAAAGELAGESSAFWGPSSQASPWSGSTTPLPQTPR